MRRPSASGQPPITRREPSGSRVALLLCALVTACSPADPEELPTVPHANGTAYADAPTGAWSVPGDEWIELVDVQPESGIDFVLHAGVEPPKNWLLETTGGGVAAFDMDGDGDQDLLFADGGTVGTDGKLQPPVPGQGTRLYRNEGGLRFTDATVEAGLSDDPAFGFGAHDGYALAVAAADWDGDGHWEFVLGGYDDLHLFRNRGDGTFEDVTEERGLGGVRFNNVGGFAWGDLDGDGRLDLVEAQYIDQKETIDRLVADPRGPRSCRWRQHLVYCGPRGQRALPTRLWMQQADGTFRDESERIRREPELGYTFQPVLTDVDQDGDLDLYLPNDSELNALLLNDGTGHFVDRAPEAGVAGSSDYEPQASMGCDVGDFDRDGRLDLFLTHFAHEYNTLYRNRTRGADRPLFQDVSTQVGISDYPQHKLAWGTKLVDLDNDGDLDMFAACGHVYPQTESSEYSRISYDQTNQVRRNRGAPDFRFDDVSERTGEHFQDARTWRGACFVDLDDDGDMDVVVTSMHRTVAVLRNDGGNRNAWVRFDLRGRAPATSAAGARVEVVLDAETTLVQELLLGSSYAGSNDPRLLFGVGRADVVPSVVVTWPDGSVQELRDVEVGRTHVVRQD